jgi:hypothetical protein
VSDQEPQRPFGESWRCVGGSYRCLVLRVYDTNGRMRLSDINCRAYIFSSISKDGVVFKNAVRLEDQFVPGFPDDSLVYDMTNLLREAGAGQILSGVHQFLSLPMKKVEEVLKPHIQSRISSGADPQTRVRDCRIGYVRRAHLIMQERSMTRGTDELEAELRTLVDAVERVKVDL